MLRHTWLILLLAVLGAAGTHAQGVVDAPPHVRVIDARLRRLLDQGLVASATLRTLVARLERSDVVVYLRGGPPGDPVEGRLQFLSAAGGLRYLLVHVAATSSRLRQIALVGHELQHAVEVADAPHVVDVASFEREYARIGYASRMRHRRDAAYETAAAIRAGEQVLRDVMARERRAHGDTRRTHASDGSAEHPPCPGGDDTGG